MMPTRLTIAHVSTQRGWHGGEEQAFQLIRGLQSRGHRCIVFARGDGELARRMNAQEFEVRTFPGRGRSPLTIWRLRREFRSIKPDAIHFHDSHSLSAGGLAALGLNIPARIASRRVNLPVRSPWVYRRFCDRVIAVSDAVAKVCCECGIPNDRIRVVHDGVDPHRVTGGDRMRGRQSTGVIGNEFLILTVASLNPLKGHRYLIQALREVIRTAPMARLALAGDGKSRRELERLAAESGVADRVLFLGYRRDVPDLLQAADLFVLPSHTEGLGSSLIDVMFARVPIVTTDAGGIPEVVGRIGVSGTVEEAVAMMVPPRNPEALAAAIGQMIDSPHQRASLIDRAERRAHEMFTADRMVHATLQVYHELLGEPSPPEV